MPLLVALSLALLILLPGGQAVSEPRHGISVFGKLKYGPDFQHFDWADPAAPKGGLLRIRDLGTFDTVNLYILKGRRPNAVQLHEIRLHERLMVRSYDEPDAHYALVAKTVDLADDGRTATFQLDTRARFHDGSPIRAEDVVWSLNTIREEGHPVLRSVFAKATAEALAPDRVRFSFAQGAPRDLAVRVAGDLPILSATYYATRDFTETTLDPPLGSGPYRISKVRSGSSVEVERVTDYWAADLPVNRGLWNFDTIRVDYYQDRTSALLAFFADEYDFREEFTSKSWATEYDDKQPVQDGRIERLTLSDGRPSGAQGWFLNLRRDRFADPRVRKARGSSPRRMATCGSSTSPEPPRRWRCSSGCAPATRQSSARCHPLRITSSTRSRTRLCGGLPGCSTRRRTGTQAASCVRSFPRRCVAPSKRTRGSPSSTKTRSGAPI